MGGEVAPASQLAAPRPSAGLARQTPAWWPKLVAQERQLFFFCAFECLPLLLVLAMYLVLDASVYSGPFCACPFFLPLSVSSPAIADIVIMDASSSCALFASSKVGWPCH